MSDQTVDADAFGMTLSRILENLGNNVNRLTPEAIEHALQTGEKAWKENAKSVLSVSYSRGGWGKIRGGDNGVETYKRGKRKGQIKSIKWYGKTYKTGKYARSIRHHMLSMAETPSGEIGSPSMPGLAHLLEKGHGYYTASAHPHIAPAYDEAAKDFEARLDDVIDEAIKDA